MKGYKHTTPEEKEAILALYARNNSTRMTADALNIRLPKVAATVKRHGIPLSHKVVAACDKNRSLLVRLAAEGKSLCEIGRQVGTNKRHVKAYLLRHGIPYTPHENIGPRNGRWKGGRRIDEDGYILLWMPDHPNCTNHGTVREHRFVMEQVLGRYLQPEEVVHHLDGDKANNHPDNLHIYESNSEHLAATLKGKCPNWTADGAARIKARHLRGQGGQRNTTRDSSGRYVALSQ